MCKKLFALLFLLILMSNSDVLMAMNADSATESDKSDMKELLRVLKEAKEAQKSEKEIKLVLSVEKKDKEDSSLTGLFKDGGKQAVTWIKDTGKCATKYIVAGVVFSVIVVVIGFVVYYFVFRQVDPYPGYAPKEIDYIGIGASRRLRDYCYDGRCHRDTCKQASWIFGPYECPAQYK